ncbi:MAG TPA: hypothetical protein EYG15_07195 [Deltaproteobacteria bacterium]|nr:hypothetical protein [Deltaproteobacteria bacterium]
MPTVLSGLSNLLSELAHHTNLQRTRHDQQATELVEWQQIQRQLERVESSQTEPLIAQLQAWLVQQQQFDQSHQRNMQVLLEQIRSTTSSGVWQEQAVPAATLSAPDIPAPALSAQAGIQMPIPPQAKPESKAPTAPDDPPLPLSRKKQRSLSRRQRFEEWGFRKLRRWAASASSRHRRTVTWLLASLLWAIRARRQVMDSNLRVALPDKSRQQRNRIAWGNYHWFARFAVDVLRLATWQGCTEAFVQVHNLEVLDAALAENRGALLVTGHLGNWEFIPAVLAERGYPLTVYAGAQTNPLTDELHNETRRGFGIHLLGKGADAVMEIWHALKQRRIVGLLIDQDERKSGVFVDFFGTPASTRRGVAAFHRMFESPVLLCVCPYVGDGVEVIFKRIEFTASGNPEADEHELLQRATSAFEQQVRKYPEQYFWMHRRWRTRPDDAAEQIY